VRLREPPLFAILREIVGSYDRHARTAQQARQMVQKRNIPQKLNLAPKEGEGSGVPALNKQDLAKNPFKFERPLMSETLRIHLFDLGVQIVHCDVSRMEIGRAIDEIDVAMQSRFSNA
jgi:hypothetical protein